MKKYLVTSYEGRPHETTMFVPTIVEEIEGELEIDGFNLIFKVDGAVVAAFEKNQVWAKEIK